MPTDLSVPFPRSAPLPFTGLFAASVALTVTALAWLPFEARTIEGVSVAVKPMKFSVSLAVLFATYLAVLPRLSPEWRDGHAMRAILWTTTAAFTFEMGYIFFQAANGAPSHFNDATGLHSTLYTLMGIGAVTLVAGIGAFGWIVARDREAELSPCLRLSIVLGFAISSLLTLLVAGYMGSSGSHHVGYHPVGGPTVPLFGWSLVTGDLRPAHFLSLHAMQALPLVALLGFGRAAVIGVGAFWTLATLVVFAMALSGLPLLP